MIWADVMADAVMVAHAAFSLFVVLGLVFILTGRWLGWRWTAGFWFRVTHLAATLVVVLRVWIGAPCPLSAAEDRLRKPMITDVASEPSGREFFHRLAFRGEPRDQFARATTLFGLITMATFLEGIRHRHSISRGV